MMSAAAAINMLQRAQPSQYPDQSEESAHFHTLNQVKLILTVNDDAPLISHYSTPAIQGHRVQGAKNL